METKGKYLGSSRGTILDMTETQWNVILDYAAKTGQRVRVRNIDEITVDGMPYSYNHICDGLDSIEAAEDERERRQDLYCCY
jgi:hypothetical protein